MAKKFTIETAVYPFRLAVWIGPWDDDGVGSFVKRVGLWNGNGRPPEHPETDAAYVSFGSGGCIYLAHKPDSPKHLGSLVHEITHAVSHAGDVLGFSLSRDSDEFYAYMAGFWMREIMSRFH